jgi:hypothetical protein
MDVYKEKIMNFLAAIVASLVTGVIVYLFFHFTHTTELSSNSVVLMFTLLTFFNFIGRNDESN